MFIRSARWIKSKPKIDSISLVIRKMCSLVSRCVCLVVFDRSYRELSCNVCVCSEIDLVIYCTGYQQSIPFFNSSAASAASAAAVEVDPRKRFQMVFALNDPYALAFVGFVRPFMGSIPMCAELQVSFPTNHQLLWSVVTLSTYFYLAGACIGSGLVGPHLIAFRARHEARNRMRLART